MAIRAAVGAGRMRVLRQFLVEGAVLAVLGGASGLMLAGWTVRLLARLWPLAVPRLAEAGIDGRVLLFTLVVSLATGALFGFGPALSFAKGRPYRVLKEGGRTSTAGSAGARARGLLVAGELALAVVLLTGAGLMVKSFWRMNERPPGFEPQRTLVLRVSLSGPHYRAMPEQLEYLDELLRRVTGAPGVEAAGIANSPIRGTVTVEGAPPFQPGQAPQTIYSSASAAYARAVGMRLAKGRWIADTEPAEVAVINQAFARRVFGDDNPIGKRIRIPRQQPAPVATIVGVVADLKYSKLDADPEPQVYLPYRQSPFVRAMDVIVRVADNPSAVAPAVRKLISDIDRSQPAYNVQTLEQALADSIAPRRFNMVLLGVFAAVALALAAVGILGVMSYAVTQRTHEIGVRMALGARRSEVVGMVVRQGMLLAAMGIVAGYGAALGLTRLMAGLLYDVKPTDPWTFAAVGVMLCAAALVACSAPALRAARVDPVVALRYE